MPDTVYTYSIQNGFPNRAVDISRLTQEIQTSSILVALDYINTTNGACNVYFRTALSSNDQSTLNTIVSNHSGTPLPSAAPRVSIANIQTTVDGRWISSPNSFPAWVTLYFTGRGDDPTNSNSIGQGQHFQMSSDTSGDGYITWQFTDIVFVLGATLVFTGAQLGDSIDYTIYAPATVIETGSTQVNLVNVGAGNIIIPSSGTGQTTVDTTGVATTIPVPNSTNTGFWDWSNSPIGFGTMSANLTQTGAFDLYDFAIPLGHPVIQAPIIGTSKAFDLLVESVTSMQVLPQWVHKATLHNSGHSGLQIGWTLAVGRAKTV